MGKIIFTITETNQPSEKALDDFHEVLYNLITNVSTEEETTYQTPSIVA